MRWYHSLTIKLIIAAGTLTAIIIGILASIILPTFREELINEVKWGASEVSDVIKRSTYLDMLANRKENVYRNIESIAENPSILGIRLFNKEGEITFSTDPAEKGTYLDKNAEACYACHSKDKPLTKLDDPERYRIFIDDNGHRVLGLITVIYNEKKCYEASCHAHPEDKTTLGVIDVKMSLKHIDQSLARGTYRMILFICIAILALSVTLGLFIRRFVSQPVNEIVAGMKKVSSGDMEHLIKISRQDEIGYLTESFNAMTLDLKKANLQIADLIGSLEEKVEQRTAELKEMHAHLVETEKLASIGRLAAGIAHELNNPLGSILLYANLVLEDMKEEGPAKENMKKIIEEVLRTRDIVKGLLEFARPKELDIRQLEIDELLDKTINMLTANKAYFSNIDVVRTFHHPALKVMADRSRIQQVFTNIIINAAEAIGEKKGRILVKTEPVDLGKYVIITVSDDGPGISTDNQRRLFEPFFTTKKKTGGTGLGLAISYGIVSRHKGTIEVHSEPGKGTTFNIKLPSA